MTSQRAVIRSHNRDLVLDGNETYLKLQTYTGAPSQFWSFQPAGLGRQNIINNENGKAIDINGGIIHGADIIMHVKHDGLNQKWYINSDNTIVSATGNLGLDVNQANFVPGAGLIAHHKHLGDNQKFYIENV